MVHSTKEADRLRLASAVNLPLSVEHMMSLLVALSADSVQPKLVYRMKEEISEGKKINELPMI